MQTFEFTIGVDWGSQKHRVCILDRRGQRVDERWVAHTAHGLREFAIGLEQLPCAREELAIGIETPHAAVIDVLLDRGFAVFTVNPKQSERFRDRHSLAGKKDDSFDAFVIANALQTDTHCFRRLQLSSALAVELRELTRIDQELSEQYFRASNRLREQLNRFYPQALQINPAADQAFFRAIIAKAPTPAHGKKIRTSTIAALLTKHRIRRLQPEQVREMLHVDAVHVAPGVCEAAQQHVAMLLPLLELLDNQQRAVRKRIEKLLDAATTDVDDIEKTDTRIIRSMPGAGALVSATLIAEASEAIAHRDYASLRAQCGVAPVTKQSGKRCVVSMRRACNLRLRQAVYHMARVGMQRDANLRNRYRQLRARGQTHGTALRRLADTQLRVLVAMLKSRTEYTINTHGLSPCDATA